MCLRVCPGVLSSSLFFCCRLLFVCPPKCPLSRRTRLILFFTQFLNLNEWNRHCARCGGVGRQQWQQHDDRFHQIRSTPYIAHFAYDQVCNSIWSNGWLIDLIYNLFVCGFDQIFFLVCSSLLLSAHNRHCALFSSSFSATLFLAIVQFYLLFALVFHSVCLSTHTPAHNLVCPQLSFIN